MVEANKPPRVLNQEVFDYFLDLEVERARRYQNYVSLLSVKLGSEEMETCEADEKSQEALLALLKSELREVDVIGRNEDGSISVILLHADLQSTEHVVERLCSRIENYAFNTEGVKATISVGGACCPTQAYDMSSLKSHAQRMLQKALKEGGNKFCIH